MIENSESQKNVLLEDDVEQNLPQEQSNDQKQESYQTSVVSDTTIQDEFGKRKAQKIKEFENRNFFIRSFGFYFILYFTLSFATIILIKFDQRRAKFFYRTLLIEKYFLILIYVSLGIKFVFGFLSRWINLFTITAYIIDCILLPFICLGLWFYFEESQRIYSINRGFWVVIFFFNIYVLSILFFFSSWFTHPKYKYNYPIGASLLILGSLITIKLLDELWLEQPMNFYQFSITFIGFIIISLYVTINSFMVLRFRANRYKENQGINCYWNFWVDWFSQFWIDLILNVRFVKKTINKKKKKAKAKRKEKYLRNKIAYLEEEKQQTLNLQNEQSNNKKKTSFLNPNISFTPNQQQTISKEISIKNEEDDIELQMPQSDINKSQERKINNYLEVSKSNVIEEMEKYMKEKNQSKVQ